MLEFFIIILSFYLDPLLVLRGVEGTFLSFGRAFEMTGAAIMSLNLIITFTPFCLTNTFNT